MKNKAISGLRRTLLRLHGLDFILRVGLARDAWHDDKSKIDLLIGYEEGNIRLYSPKIQALLKDSWPKGVLSVSDDSVRFDFGKSSCGIAVCNSRKLIQSVKEWINGENLNGQHRPWAIGYWLPEALYGDLATAESLYDAKGIYTKIKKLVVPYPPSLSQGIVNICTDEIRQKLTGFDLLTKGNWPFESSLRLSDIGAATVRLAFARSRCYLRGFRSLAEQAASLQPPDFALYELASNLLQEEKTRRTLDEIRNQF